MCFQRWRLTKGGRERLWSVDQRRIDFLSKEYLIPLVFERPLLWVPLKKIPPQTTKTISGSGVATPRLSLEIFPSRMPTRMCMAREPGPITFRNGLFEHTATMRAFDSKSFIRVFLEVWNTPPGVCVVHRHLLVGCPTWFSRWIKIFHGRGISQGCYW